MAKYPAEIYEPREKESRSGVVYDPTKKTVIFVEDVKGLDDEVVAIEKLIGQNVDGQTMPIAGGFLKGKANGQSKWSTEIFVDNNGNVGIGTTTPASKLEVAGTVQLRGAGGTTGLYVNSSGNVGIGTTEPIYKLDVRSGSNASQLHFANSGDSGGYLVSAGAGNFFMSTGSAYNGSNWVAKSTASVVVGGMDGVFSVYTNSGLIVGNTFSLSERLTIKATGNVGIGTTNPSQKLEVNGAIKYAPMSAPSNPTAGTVYYDSSENKLKVYNGSAWETISSS
jgi:hypothetical protein